MAPKYMRGLKTTLLHLAWIFLCWSEVLATVAPCVENRTESCIQNLGTFITLDKPRFATETELERLCREAEDGQRCSSDFLRSSSCVNSRDDVLISLQIGRSQAVSQLVCNTGGYIADPAFRRVYLKHSSCIEEHERKIKDCYISSGIVEDPELEIVGNSSKTSQEKHITACCPVVQYVECSENAIGTSCGDEAKTVVLKIILTAAGKQLQDFCTNVDERFPNSPTACISSAISHAVSFSVMILICFCAMCHVIFNILFCEPSRNNTY